MASMIPKRCQALAWVNSRCGYWSNATDFRAQQCRGLRAQAHPAKPQWFPAPNYVTARLRKSSGSSCFHIFAPEELYRCLHTFTSIHPPFTSYELQNSIPPHMQHLFMPLYLRATKPITRLQSFGAPDFHIVLPTLSI